MNIVTKLTTELGINPHQVTTVIEMLDGGATVPFISRYRKEATGSLTDTQLRLLESRLGHFRELEARRQTIIKSITEQGKLTPELEAKILETDSKPTLEDLYLPYKPKRRTKAQIAIEAGLGPLAEAILANPEADPANMAESYIDPEKQIPTSKEALDGAKHILMNHFCENADLLASLRHYCWQHGQLESSVMKGKETKDSKFSDYFSHAEPIKKIPSHRALALFRGQREEVLYLTLKLDDEAIQHCLQEVRQAFNLETYATSMHTWLANTIEQTWRLKLALKLEVDLFMHLRETAEEEAINVFSSNLKHLLMAAPAGEHVTMALDPGLRTGVKVVVIDQTGKLLSNTTIFPHAPRHDWDKSIEILAALCKKFSVTLISIGNGTASRETDKLVNELKKRHADLSLTSIVVSEAGASVYSASELAANEFPDLDVTYRGAVSIGRRLQDPLAELVKIDPKSIGVGQYQHDVNQSRLARALHAVMEDCVNAVGVDVNTASVPLLSCIAGLNETIARNIVHYRETNGAFKNRHDFKSVPRLGEKAFEQAAGFLRINSGENPLDASAVHPEAYEIVEHILKRQRKNIKELIGNKSIIQSINPADYINEKFGLITIRDIFQELEKPGRDPRPEFKTATFKEDVNTIDDLYPDMQLEGVITNVAQFGAFVDIGVHQDGLVHISMLADKYVKDPNDVVKVGDIVKVRVISVDKERKRIQLSMRSNDSGSHTKETRVKTKKPTQSNSFQNHALANALQSALDSSK